MASTQWGGTSTVGGSSSPVTFTITSNPSTSVLYAIPIIGILIRVILLIPHIIALYIMVIICELAQLVLWIPTLTSGQYPAIGYTLCGGTMRWALRVACYLYGLCDQYPPFGFGSENDGYPVNVSWDPSTSGSKLFAIPIVGFVIRVVVLIPHLIILYIIGAVVGLLQYILWIWVLFLGGYPEFGFTFVTGYLRWAARVYSYLLGLTDSYPPFQLAA